MSLLPDIIPVTAQTHLGTLEKRLKNLNKLQGWPQYGKFLDDKGSMISKLISDLDDSNSLEEYYALLKKASQIIGNQLQEIYNRKSTSKFFTEHLGKSTQLPCPDSQLHYFMTLTFENIMRIYAEKITEAQKSKKSKRFPTALLGVYLHEMRMIEQDLEGTTAPRMMLEYLDQWGNNAWPPTLKTTEIVPRSWTQCIAKMQQILAQDWKPAPEVVVIADDGTTTQVTDDTKSLSSFVAHRAFFLALYLYCVVHPQFFVNNFESIVSKTKEAVLGDLLVEWVQKRVDTLKSNETQSGASPQSPEN